MSKLPKGMTKEVIVSSIKDWEEFKKHGSLLLMYGRNEDEVYDGLCSYFLDVYNIDNKETHKFLKRNYPDKIKIWCKPDTIETRLEILNDILTKINNGEFKENG